MLLIHVDDVGDSTPFRFKLEKVSVSFLIQYGTKFDAVAVIYEAATEGRYST